MVDVTDHVRGLNSRVMFLGITFEMLILMLQGGGFFLFATLMVYDIRRRKFNVQVPPGCFKLGLKGGSNITDEFDAKYDQGTTDTSQWRVKALYVHPIKSCQGIEIDEAEMDAAGMIYDRKFVFAEWRQLTKADADDERPVGWQHRTLREPKYEKLASVRPEVWIPKRAEGGLDTRRVEQEGCVIVRYPNVPTGPFAALDRFVMAKGLLPKERWFKLPLMPRKGHRYPKDKLAIWNDTVEWINLGEHLPHDFQDWLGIENPITIFRADPENYRNVYGNAPRADELGWQPQVAAVDSYPLHMINIASVHDVGAKLGDSISQLSFRRFRPNVLVQGPAAYDEDDWKKCKIGDYEMYCSCRTTRCRLPNVDPDTAVRNDTEPDKTLRSFRCIDPGAPKQAALGLQLLPAKKAGMVLRVGDKVEVCARGKHHVIK